MFNRKLIENNIHLIKYIKSSLRESGLVLAKIPNKSYLVGSSLSSMIESFFKNEKFNLNKNQDIDIFVEHQANTNFTFSGKLRFLNDISEDRYSYTKAYEEYFSKYPTIEKRDPDDRYSYINIKQALPANYYVAGNVKDGIFDYTFIHRDNNFHSKRIIDSFDFNSLKILYDFELERIIFDDEYIEYMASKKVSLSSFVDSNSFLEEYDQILPSLLRLLKKTDDKPNYKALIKLYFSILINTESINEKNVLRINKLTGICKINSSVKEFSIISNSYLKQLINNLDFFKEIFYVELSDSSHLCLQLKDINDIQIINNNMIREIEKNFIDKFRKVNNRDISKMNFIFDLIYQRCRHD